MEENERNETMEQVEDMTQDYLETIQNLKKNTVSREEFDKLKAENKKLLNAVVDGQTIEQEQEPQFRDPREIRDELFNHEHNNLEYMTLALELRNTLIAQGEPDPFLPIGNKIAPTEEDYKQAEKCAQVFQECVDYADGDSALFTQELQRRTNKDVLTKRR